MKAPAGPAAIGGTGAPADGATSARAKLRAASHQLEGMFVRQLFEAMRKTTQTSGSGEKSPGGEMFTSMLDDALADQAAQRFDHGIGEALYRQLSRHLGPEPSQGPAAEPGTASKPADPATAPHLSAAPAAAFRLREPDDRP
jgi:Rod binding domain-containing protein